MQKLRRLMPAGIARFEEFLNSLKTPTPLDRPIDALNAADTSEPLDVEIEINARKFGSRFAAARYLDSKLGELGLKNIERDCGLWAWLSLFYFDELCPADGHGRQILQEPARYLLESLNSRRYYKHLLAGPYLIFRAHRDAPERALAFLYGPLNELSEFVNQLASKQEVVTNKSLVEVVARLYLDPSTGKPKRGFASQKAPGSVRRFAMVINQLDCTWDLYAMPIESVLTCLPREFDRFRKGEDTVVR